METNVLKGNCTEKWNFHIVLRFQNNDEQKSLQVSYSRFSHFRFLMKSLMSKASKSLYNPYIKGYIGMTINRPELTRISIYTNSGMGKSIMTTKFRHTQYFVTSQVPMGSNGFNGYLLKFDIHPPPPDFLIV